MSWSTFKLVLQMALLLPVIAVLAYVGFWFSFIFGPLIVGVIVIVIAVYVTKELIRNEKDNS